MKVWEQNQKGHEAHGKKLWTLFYPLLRIKCLESLNQKFGLQEEALYTDMRLWAPHTGV